MNPLTMQDVDQAIIDFGLVTLDRTLVEASVDSPDCLIHYVNTGGDPLREHLSKEHKLPDLFEKMHAAPWLGDVIITTSELEGGFLAVLHVKVTGDDPIIFSFPFASEDGESFVPATYLTAVSREKLAILPNFPLKLTDVVATDFMGITGDQMKATLVRLVIAALAVALENKPEGAVN